MLLPQCVTVNRIGTHVSPSPSPCFPTFFRYQTYITRFHFNNYFCIIFLTHDQSIFYLFLTRVSYPPPPPPPPLPCFYGQKIAHSISFPMVCFIVVIALPMSTDKAKTTCGQMRSRRPTQARSNNALPQNKPIAHLFFSRH